MSIVCPWSCRASDLHSQRPLRLLRPNDAHTELEVVEGTLSAILEMQLEDIRVVSLVGSARGGKSLLLYFSRDVQF